MSAVEGAANKADIEQVSTRNITSPQVLGVVAAVGGLFVLLAACRVLPSGVNGISQLGVGGKVLGAAFIAGGATAVMCCRNLHATTKPVATEAQHVSQLFSRSGWLEEEKSMVNFGLINGKLVPIEKSWQSSEGFVLSKHSAAEVLFLCAKPKYWSCQGQEEVNPIKYILEHPKNGGLITKEEFTGYLLEDNRFTDLYGEALVEALSLIDSLDESTAGRLIEKELQTGYSPREDVIKAVAERAPEAAITEDHARKVLYHGKLEAANALKNCIKPSEECNTLFRIAAGESELDLPLQNAEACKEAYRIAHIYKNDGIVKRLAPRMPTTKAPTGLNVLEGTFPPTLNLPQMREQARNYLTGLRKQGILLTKEEFKKAHQPNKKYFCKGNRTSIGRLLGKTFLEETAQTLNLKTIKVPKKFAVIKEGNQFDFSITRGGGLLFPKILRFTLRGLKRLDGYAHVKSLKILSA